MKKVLCIGDSLALPGHHNLYEDTWFYKLKIEFPEFDFLSFFKRQLTTDVLITLGGGERGIDKWPRGADCFEAYMPDIVIIQLGIVDCAPRLLTIFDKVIIKFLPNSLLNTYIFLMKMIRKRNINNTLVPFANFKSNLNNYVKRVERYSAKLVIVSISLPDKSFVEKNSQIITNVNKYNDFLKEISSNFSFIYLTPALKQSDYNFKIYEDGYHPNRLGNEIILNSLRKYLSEFN